MDVLSKCTVVRTVGKVGVRLRALGMIGGRNENKTHIIKERSAL
jgi:hypothetical protein